MNIRLNLVPAGQGPQWVKLGMRVFRKQPIAMTGQFFMLVAIVTLVSYIPLIGPALGLALLPALTAGIMNATDEVIQGRFPLPGVLFAPLRASSPHRWEMIKLGLLYSLCFLGVMGLSALIDGGTFAKTYLVGGKLDAQTLQDSSFVAAMYLSLACYLPISLAFWHAPALVFWHGLPATKSIFFSAVACKRNFWAFAIYGLVWFGWMLLSGVLVSLTGLIVGPVGMQALMMMAILVVAAMFFASIFFTFRDCFNTTDNDITSQESPHEPA